MQRQFTIPLGSEEYQNGYSPEIHFCRPLTKQEDYKLAEEFAIFLYEHASGQFWDELRRYMEHLEYS